MPVNINALLGSKKNAEEIISKVLSKDLNEVSEACGNAEKTKFHATKYYTDIYNNKVLKAIFTLITTNDTYQINDLDFMVVNNNKAKIKLLSKIDDPDGTCEYYEASNIDEDAHFGVELVNHYIKEEDKIDKVFDVFLSAFPEELSVYKTIDELNKKLGLSKEIEIPSLGKKALSLSENFMSFLPKDNSILTFICGKVEDFKKVRVFLGDNNYSFYIIYIDTLIGILPTVASDTYFDLRKLKKGTIIGMNATIKADMLVNENDKYKTQ